MRINLTTRLLHLLMVVTALCQLLSSVWMKIPEPGKLPGFETKLFFLHIALAGWVAVVISGAYALTRFYEADAWGRLVPWFSAVRRVAFFKSACKEIPDVFRGRLAPPEEKGALAGAVHGFGFLLLIGLGVTGSYVMLGLRTDGTMRSDVLLVFDFHQLFGKLIWTFIGAHLFMTLYHMVLGQRKILDIFRFSTPSR